MVQMMALGVQNPKIDALGSFQQGAQQQMGANRFQRQEAEAAMETVASMALGVMDGKLDGEANPQKWEQSLDYLSSMGMDVEQFRGKANLAPVIARAGISAMDQMRLANSDRDYELAMSRFDLELQKAMQTAQAGPEGSLGAPVWGTDASGNPVAMQVTKGGELRQLEQPEGVQLSTGVDKVDLGTQWGLMDKRSGQMIGTLPKDVAGEAAATEEGKVLGKTRATADTDIRSAEQTVSLVDELIALPGFNEIFGPVDQYRPKLLMSDSGRDAMARLDQLKGKTFLEAYAMLKGGGQITEVEGLKAEAAMARLDRAQDEETAKKALEDFRDAVQTGAQKLRERTQKDSAPTDAKPSPRGPADMGEVVSQDQYDMLPSGAEFIWQGQRYRKP